MKDMPKLKPTQIVYVGLRDVDPGEKELMVEHGIKAYSMHDIDRVRPSLFLSSTLSLAVTHTLSLSRSNSLSLLPLKGDGLTLSSTTSDQ